MGEEWPDNDHKWVDETVKKHINEKTGSWKTAWEVEQEDSAEEEKKLQEASEKPYYTLPDELVNDWPGDRFVTTHRCFGGPCKGDDDLPMWHEGTLLQTDAELGHNSKHRHKFPYGAP